jgi:hypothetical protein
MTFRILPVVALAAAACAHAPGGDYTPARESWTDARYDDLVAQWGAPARTAKLENGGEVHTWVSETSRTRLGGFPSIGVGIFGGGGGSGVGVGAGFPIGGGADFIRCERNVVVREGRIVDQTWHGETDYCDSFRRR